MRDLHTLEKYRDTAFERQYYGTVPIGWGHRNMFPAAAVGCYDVKHFPANRHPENAVSSVSVCAVAPTWEEMCEIKRMFFQENETVVEYHPAKADYVNLHPLCLHLWRPTVMHMPKPPKIFV